MKELIKWCHMNDVNITEKMENKANDSTMMLEQIHAIIPNLMYLIRMQLLFTGELMSDEKVAPRLPHFSNTKSRTNQAHKGL